MNNILFSVILILSSLNLFLYLSNNIHIYQLNHYKPDAQIKWSGRNILKLTLQSILYFVLILAINIEQVIYAALAIGVILLGIFINIPKKAKKPLVYTSRVKRLILTTYLTIIVAFLIVRQQNVILISTYLLMALTPILLLVVDLLNKPINNLVNRKYVNDAKKIINGMPNLTVIGITGSFGKTSTKNFLYKLLSSKYDVLMTPKNYNTTLGVTMTIRNELKATHEIFICEMGATRVNDIKEICDIVKPKYGIITSIGPQHLESFKSIENVIKTKFELADSLPDDGIAFLNYDNKYIKDNKIDKNVVAYGIENGKDYLAYDISATDKGVSFKMRDVKDEEFTFNTKVLGKHNIVNISGCIAVANKLGISMKTLVQRVKLIEGVEHRQQLITSGSDLIIDDAYNSNPSGAASALETLSMFDGEKILITPGMIELGDKQYDYNFEFGKQAAKVCNYIVLVGKKQTKPIYDGIMAMKFSKDKLQIVEDVKEGIKIARNLKTGKKRRIILLENDLPDNY